MTFAIVPRMHVPQLFHIGTRRRCKGNRNLSAPTGAPRPLGTPDLTLGGNRFVRPCAPYEFPASLKSWTARKVIWFKECGCTGMEIEAGSSKLHASLKSVLVHVILVPAFGLQFYVPAPNLQCTEQ